MKTAGYSGTPLTKKLGIKEGSSIRLVNQPSYYLELFDDFPKKVKTSAKSNLDFIHYFTTESKKFIKDLAGLKKSLQPNGMIWISWPKKTAKMASDMNENLIREVALQSGLVDVKVCAVDEVWSGLKLVIPVKDRKQ